MTNEIKEELRQSEKIYDYVRTKMLQSGDEILIKLLKIGH